MAGWLLAPAVSAAAVLVLGPVILVQVVGRVQCRGRPPAQRCCTIPASPTRAGSSLASEPGPAGARRRSRSEELRGSGESGGGGARQHGGPSSDGTASVYSAAGSARSSFALEHASMEANRASLEAFQEAFATGPLMPPAAPPPQPSPPATPTAAPAVSLVQLADAAQLPASLRDK